MSPNHAGLRKSTLMIQDWDFVQFRSYLGRIFVRDKAIRGRVIEGMGKMDRPLPEYLKFERFFDYF
jgi:hypothetical protein